MYEASLNKVQTSCKQTGGHLILVQLHVLLIKLCLCLCLSLSPQTHYLATCNYHDLLPKGLSQSIIKMLQISFESRSTDSANATGWKLPI